MLGITQGSLVNTGVERPCALSDEMALCVRVRFASFVSVR